MALKITALVFVILLSVTLSEFPVRSQNGGLADMTFAIGLQDSPTGVYYDRDFDFPTGEAMWFDVPVAYIDLVFLFCALACFGATVWPKHKVILH